MFLTLYDALSSGRLAAATVTFSAGEEFIYTLIFVIYSGVSDDTPWILDNFIKKNICSHSWYPHLPYPSYMVALVLTMVGGCAMIEGSVRVRVAEFEPFFHCKVNISGYVCTLKEK